MNISRGMELALAQITDMTMETIQLRCMWEGEREHRAHLEGEVEELEQQLSEVQRRLEFAEKSADELLVMLKREWEQRERDVTLSAKVMMGRKEHYDGVIGGLEQEVKELKELLKHG